MTLEEAVRVGADSRGADSMMTGRIGPPRNPLEEDSDSGFRPS